ncbi:hypothetical protein [Shewanella goraebulensis]|uniref:hypothetical protein n=1 Tax=Shewanella goraebulensis TaxID=3050637 RepID=UPI00254F966D|nr:hypothetical protein [Shewanella goraebulensis]
MTKITIKRSIRKDDLASNRNSVNQAVSNLIDSQVNILALNGFLNSLQLSPKDAVTELDRYSEAHPDSLRKACHPFATAPAEDVQSLKLISDTYNTLNAVKADSQLDGIAQGSAANGRIEKKLKSQRASSYRKGNGNHARKQRTAPLYDYLDRLRAEKGEQYLLGTTNAALARAYLSSLDKGQTVEARTFANYIKQYKIEMPVTL